MAQENFAALILAAGYSSRMGEFKPLLDLAGERVISRSVSVFRDAGLKDVYVVVGHRGPELAAFLEALQVRIVWNEGYDRGMYSSVLVGLAAMAKEKDGFFLLPADIPLVRSQTIHTLLHKQTQTGYSVIYPRFEGQRGHPPLITRKCYDRILSQDFSGNLREVLQYFDQEACDVDCSDEGILLDMDTPQDYRNLQTFAEGHRVPTRQECQDLYDRYQVPERVIRHSQAVSETALTLAQAMGHQVLSFDLERIRAGAMLHDLAKGQPHHAEAGAAILRREGFSSVASLVERHMDLAVDRKEVVIDEAAVIYLADKVTQQEELISIEERFAKALEKFRGEEAVLKKVKQRQENALLLKRRIETLLGVPDLYQFLKEQRHGR